MKTKLTKLARELRKVRTSKGHRQVDAAKLIKVSSEYISMIETGKRTPQSVKIVERIEKYIGMNK